MVILKVTTFCKVPESGSLSDTVETILGKLFTVRYGAIEALETFRQLNNQEKGTHSLV